MKKKLANATAVTYRDSPIEIERRGSATTSRSPTGKALDRLFIRVVSFSDIHPFKGHCIQGGRAFSEGESFLNRDIPYFSALVGVGEPYRYSG